MAGFPEWFVSKWQDAVHFGAGNRLPLSSKIGAKAHGYWSMFEQDLQKAYPWEENPSSSFITLVYLHECGGLTRVEIGAEQIRYHDPTGWRKTYQNMAHDWGDRCRRDIEDAEAELDE